MFVQKVSGVLPPPTILFFVFTIVISELVKLVAFRDEILLRIVVGKLEE